MNTVMVWTKTVSGVAGCVAALTLLAGCASVVDGSGTPVGSANTAAPSTAPTRTLGTALESIAIRTSDLATGERIRLAPGGAAVSGEVTLDNCGFDFTTESDRVARRQYAVTTASGAPTGRSNELVAYSSASQAQRALEQWYTSAATCPRTPVHSHVAGVPDFTMRVLRNVRRVPGLPVAANVLTVESATDAAHETENLIAILQRRGRFLDAIYALELTTPTRSDLAAAEHLAVVTGTRLVALK